MCRLSFTAADDKNAMKTTNGFLNKINNHIVVPEQTYLVKMEVKSLNKNIKTLEGFLGNNAERIVGKR